jgi:hypothetical protein
MTFPEIPQSLVAPWLQNLLPHGLMAKNPRQEGDSFLNIADGTWVADLVRFAKSGTAEYDVTISDAGLKLEVATAQASVAAGDYVVLELPVEAVNLIDLKLGTADATDITFGFEISTNIASDQTYVFNLRDGLNVTSYSQEFTVLANADKQPVTITIPGDTASSWGSGTDRGWQPTIVLAAGSTFHQTADQWDLGLFLGTSTMSTAFRTTIGNYIEVDKIRAYPGEVDLGAHYPSKQEVRAYCERYLYTWLMFIGSTAYQHGGNWQAHGIETPVMRASPSVFQTGDATATLSLGWNATISRATVYQATVATASSSRLCTADARW